MSEGPLESTEGLFVRKALRLKLEQGANLCEYVVKNPENKIALERVSDVNPEY